MNSIFVAVLMSFAVSSALGSFLTCKVGPDYDAKEFLNMTEGCVDNVKKQIQTEIGASIQYLAMGAHFAQDTVNRPGFSEFFFKAAGEEREHAMKLMEYLLMRGAVHSFDGFIRWEKPITKDWSGLDALKDALKKEASVTDSIKNLIKTCESDDKENDYHFVDYLTGEFLEEQYRGQRDLAGMISTLSKMVDQTNVLKPNAALGEFLFDKQIMK